MKVTINQVVEYKGHNVKQSGVVNLVLTSNYDEITKSMQLLQLIGNDVTIKAKMPDKHPVMVGTFFINGINFAKDGKSTLKFSSINTAVNMDVFQDMISENRFRVQFFGNIETNDNEEEGE